MHLEYVSNAQISHVYMHGISHAKTEKKSPKLTSAEQYIKKKSHHQDVLFPLLGYTASNRSFDSHPIGPQGSLLRTCMIIQAKDQPQPSVSTVDTSLTPQGAESDRTC